MEATKVRLEAVAYLPGTDGSNPFPSSGESANFRFLKRATARLEDVSLLDAREGPRQGDPKLSPTISGEFQIFLAEMPGSAPT
jgi:hypothetical protein